MEDGQTRIHLHLLQPIRVAYVGLGKYRSTTHLYPFSITMD